MKSIMMIVLMACLFPYIFAMLARVYGGFKFSEHQQQSRQFLAQLSGKAERANEIQQNSLQSLLIFLPAVWFATHMMVPLVLVHKICLFYLLSRVLYALCHLSEWRILAVVMAFLAFCCCVFLFALTIYFV